MGRKGNTAKKRSNRAPLIIAMALGLAVLVGGFAMMSGGNSGGNTVAISPTPVSINSVQQGLEQFRGKIVVLDFWATWCGPCRSEIPGLISIQNEYRSQGVEIIGVSIDPISPRGPNGGARAVEPFMKQYGINYTVWMVNSANALAGYDITRGIPTKYILGRDGQIKKTYIGARPKSVVENDIKELL